MLAIHSPNHSLKETRMNRMNRSTLLAAFTIVALSLAGCSDRSDKPAGAGGNAPRPGTSTASGTTTPGGAAATGAMGLPEGMVVRTAMPDAVGVGSCKASARLGDSVVVVGRIGGSRTPFVGSRAIFTLVDPAVKSCSDGADPDHCKTPWDYCCTPREELNANMITVEIADANGKALPFSVRGASGLEPAARVSIAGKVVERNDEGLFVVRAEKIAVE